MKHLPLINTKHILTFILIGAVLTPTIPGTGVKDLSQPRKVIENGVIYETFPGTDLKDLSKPRYIIEDGEIHETFPGTDIIDLDGDSYEVDSYGYDEYLIDE